MDSRTLAREAFLARVQPSSARLEALPADASFRRYFRVVDGDAPLMLMDAPPDRENVRPFVQVATHLLALGLSAPRILAEDESSGFLLLEDLGNDTFTNLLAEGADETALYDVAVDVLAYLHGHADNAAIDLPPYDEATLLGEASLLTEWYLPALTGAPCPAPAHEAWLAAWRLVFASLPTTPSVFVHRDYHVDNLMRLAGRDGVAACGLLDFQDALIGSPAYDLVSLIEDARRDLTPGLGEHIRDRYLSALPDTDARSLDAWCHALGAQRHAKVAGIFVRLRDRDGKSGYIRHLPRVLRLFRRTIAHPVLAPVQRWADVHLDLDRVVTSQ